MRHSWLSTSSECFLKSLRGKSRGIQKTLSLIRAANSHHNIPAMYSSILVVDTWLIHVHQNCIGRFWLLLGHVLAMFSLYTYHHLPKFQHALWYVFSKLNPACFPCFPGAKDYITLFLHVQSAPPVANPRDSPEVLSHKPTSDSRLSAYYYGRQLNDTEHHVF
jgi:hypothetical protein